MDTLNLDASELDAVNALLDEAEGELPELDDPGALHHATVLAHHLPDRIRLFLNAFRLGQLSGVLRISGYRIDQDRVGPTPVHWRGQVRPSRAHREELLLVLFASLLGDPFSWATQQDGRLIHDVLPIKGHENEQLGSSSSALLTWHTEDAFHPLRGDWLTFACLRNPYRAPTTVGYIDDLDLADCVRDVLRQERFIIHPDEAHLAKNNAAPDDGLFEGIMQMLTQPEPVAVLFGDPDHPYVRADPYFMAVADGDHEAQVALDLFVKAMDELMTDLALRDGEFCFIDNFRVVHGRKPFTARFDGTDRWLKRINVTCDLRKSRAERGHAHERAIR